MVAWSPKLSASHPRFQCRWQVERAQANSSKSVAPEWLTPAPHLFIALFVLSSQYLMFSDKHSTLSLKVWWVALA